LFEEGVQHLVAPVAQADEAKANALAGAEGAQAPKRRGGPGGGQRFGKSSSGQRFH
jgi:hypothetical protein